MISLLFVGDGPLDAAVVPTIVERILNTSVEDHCVPWARLNVRGHGYSRKLQYATRQARDRGASGLVATIDRDKAARRERLRELREGRERDRATNPPLPTAVGEAVPHLEAWLLDDQKAVRTVLQLDAAAEILTVRTTKDPKQTLKSLLVTSPRCNETILVVWTEIAVELDSNLCVHSAETGFKAFADDVRHELGPLADNG